MHPKRNPGSNHRREGREREFRGSPCHSNLSSLDFQALFFTEANTFLSIDRLHAYTLPQGEGPPDPRATMARYLLNMALCSSLYAPLQLCEIALRNAIHAQLRKIAGSEAWYDATDFPLTAWAETEINKAKLKLERRNKPVTPGRMVAELTFGFWTHLFEDHYERNTAFLPRGIKAIFKHLPKSLHNRKTIKRDLESIRQLRNRVFHHERIIHFKDLDSIHAHIHTVIGWISPSLHSLANTLDQFRQLRAQGLRPWLQQFQHSHKPTEPRITIQASHRTAQGLTAIKDQGHRKP